MDFSDKRFDLADFVFQGAVEREPTSLCGEAVLDALQRWQSRDDPSEPAASLFRLDETRSFTISYDGKAGDYWPDENSNWLGECLVRDFLFKNGVCKLDTLSPRLYVAKYKLEAMIDTEYLLVCPYPTEAGNIGGIVVVCVNQRLKPTSRAS